MRDFPLQKFKHLFILNTVDTESISVPPLMMSRVVNSGTTLLSPLVSEPNSRQLSTSGI